MSNLVFFFSPTTVVVAYTLKGSTYVRQGSLMGNKCVNNLRREEFNKGIPWNSIGEEFQYSRLYAKS